MADTLPRPQDAPAGNPANHNLAPAALVEHALRRGGQDGGDGQADQDHQAAALFVECLTLKKKKSFGNDLLSQGAAPQVPSALTSLTSGFGMGPGVPISLKSPRDNFTRLSLNSIL